MSILRPCSPAMAAALGPGIRAPSDQADLFTLTLVSGTVYRWTSYVTDLVIGGNTFVSTKPWLKRGRWNLVNTMEIPQLEITILDNTQTAFGSGSTSLRNQIVNGLLDGATFELDRVLMPTPGDVTTLGTIPIYLGIVGNAEVQGATATIQIDGGNTQLSVNAPVNLYQPGCIHTFCDAGCTLSQASFTQSLSISSATTTVLTITAATPINNQIKGGTVTMTSGASALQKRKVVDFSLILSSLGFLTLAYPLPAAPAPGDTLTLFYACDKLNATCTGVYANGVNYRGTPYLPPPSLTAPNQIT